MRHAHATIGIYISDAGNFAQMGDWETSGSGNYGKSEVLEMGEETSKKIAAGRIQAGGLQRWAEDD
jgi:hypothetical protein